MKKHLLCIAAAAAVALVFCSGASAKPGRTVLTLMERVETHSDVVDPTPLHNVGSDTFVYSLLSAFRKLDTGVYGNLYYLNKYSIDDRTSAAHIFGVDVMADLTGKWKYDIGYSHNVSPKINAFPFNDTDRFNMDMTFKVNPNEKAAKKWELKTSYNTGTDFSQGRTLSGKISASDKITKNTTYNASYQFVWGLSKTTNAAGICSICREQYANQYALDLTHKMSKTNRIQLGFLFLKNLYNGAQGDDMIYRLTWFHTIR